MATVVRGNDEQRSEATEAASSKMGGWAASGQPKVGTMGAWTLAGHAPGADRLSPLGAGFLACRKDGHTLFILAAKEKANVMPSSASFCSIDVRCLGLPGRLGMVISTPKTPKMEFRDLN